MPGNLLIDTNSSCTILSNFENYDLAFDCISAYYKAFSHSPPTEATSPLEMEPIEMKTQKEFQAHSNTTPCEFIIWDFIDYHKENARENIELSTIFNTKNISEEPFFEDNPKDDDKISDINDKLSEKSQFGYGSLNSSLLDFTMANQNQKKTQSTIEEPQIFAEVEENDFPKSNKFEEEKKCIIPNGIETSWENPNFECILDISIQELFDNFYADNAKFSFKDHFLQIGTAGKEFASYLIFRMQRNRRRTMEKGFSWEINKMYEIKI